MRVLAHGTPTQKEDSRMNAFTIYEKHPAADAYRVGGFYSPYALVSTEKRFTEAELVSEYWASHGTANALMTGNPRLLFSRRAALRRFATSPHASESDYQ